MCGSPCCLPPDLPPIFQDIFRLSAPAQQPCGRAQHESRPVGLFPGPNPPQARDKWLSVQFGFPCEMEGGEAVSAALPHFSPSSCCSEKQRALRLNQAARAGPAAQAARGHQGLPFCCQPSGPPSPLQAGGCPADSQSGCPFGTRGKRDSRSGSALRTVPPFPLPASPSQVRAAPPLRHLAPSS